MISQARNFINIECQLKDLRILIKIMLFTAHKPLQIDFLPDKKILILTKNKVLLTHLQFIEEFIVIHLISDHPNQMIHHTDRNETLVASKQSIQVHYCDWSHQTQLRMFISLNEECIKSIRINKGIWELYGEIYQYPPKNMKFFHIQEISDEHLPNYFCQNFQFFIHSGKLTAYDHFLKIKHDIQWKEATQIINQYYRNKEEIRLTVTRVQSQNMQFIVVLNDEYCLFIKDQWKAELSLKNYVLYIRDNLIISKTTENKLHIYQIQNHQVCSLGTLPPYPCALIGGTIIGDKIYMIVYDLKEIIIKTTDLIFTLAQESQQTINQYTPKRQIIHQTSNKEHISSGVPPDLINKNATNHRKSLFEGGLMNRSYEVPSPGLSHRSDISSPKLNIQSALKASITKFQEELKNSIQYEQEIPVIHKDRGQNKLMNENPNQNQNENINQNENQNVNANELIQSNTPTLMNNDIVKEKIIDSPADENVQIENSDFYDEESITLNENKNENGVGLFNSSEVVDTPGFRFDSLDGEGDLFVSGKSADRWGNFNKSWNNFYQNEAFNMRESIESLEAQSFNTTNIIQTQKVKYFAPQNTPLTYELSQQINKKKYTQLMSELFKKNPQKFDDYLYRFLNEILKEDEAIIFFAEHIRISNPQFTRDRILRLYMCLKDTEENKAALTKALSEFKLIEVPKICLSFHPDIVSIFLSLYPQVYLGDLLAPDVNLIKKLMDSYFGLQAFESEQLTIQDEIIDITHPRNILNILLFLNEFYQLSIEKIFDIYCAKMIKNDYADIIKKLVKEEEVFQICGVSKEILNDIVQVSVKRFLAQDHCSMNYVQEIISILPQNKESQLMTIVHVVNFLNSKEIQYLLDSLFIINQKKCAFNFAVKIIEDNAVSKLIKIKMPILFKLLWFIQEEQDLKIYNKQLLILTQNLVEKYLKNNLINTAFETLVPISYVIKKGFIANIFHSYLDGRFINRLADHDIEYQTFYDIFPELIKIKNDKIILLPHDKIVPPLDSKSFSCSWEKFQQIYHYNFISSSPQIQYIIYRDVDLALQLTHYQIIPQQNLSNLLKDLHSFRKQNTEQRASKKTLKLDSSIKIALIEESESNRLFSDGSKEYVGEQKDQNTPNELLVRSMNSIGRKPSDDPKKKLCRSHDIINHEDQNEDDDPLLQNIKLQVESAQITQSLRNIYVKLGRQKFIKAVTLIDREKVHLFHYQSYKMLHHLHLSYEYERVIPFEYFLCQRKEDSLPFAISKVKMELNFQNFWVVYMIFEVIYGKSVQVFQILLEKIIIYQQNDDLAQIVGMLSEKIKVQKQFMSQMMKKCKQKKLNKILEVLQNGLILI